MKSLLLLSLFLITTGLFSQNANTFDSKVPNDYYDFSLKLVKQTPGFTPPVAARAFGYTGLALYESIVPGILTHTSTQGIIYGLTDVTLPDAGADYHWPTVANNALATILDSLFRIMTPENKFSLDSIRSAYNVEFENFLSPEDFFDSRSYGEAIARDIFEYSRTDGGHNGFASNFPADYVPPVGEDLWVPFGMQVCLQPYWGNNRPFIEADTASTTISPPPPSFSTVPGSEFYEYANQVYTTGLNLTPEQSTIAFYWADGGGSITPAGHSISMLTNVLEDENANLEEAVISYAKLSIALSDAFLACWKTKYLYNLCRPVTYIRSHMDSTWLPLMGTPPFPEYPSGHSSQSGAMGTVMTSIFGPDYSFTDETHGPNFGGPRTFDSFNDAAQEAAISRLYGGIHYEFGNNAGLNLGTIVGNNVNELFNQVNVATDPVADIPSSLLMYPNPAMDMVYVKSDPALIGSEYFLVDMYGKVLATGRINHEITSLSIGHYSAGMYLFRAGD
ncbi:MAG: phosphatase PAP2 family protein, partial [Saprospiraceae bacterium]